MPDIRIHVWRLIEGTLQWWRCIGCGLRSRHDTDVPLYRGRLTGWVWVPDRPAGCTEVCPDPEPKPARGHWMRP